MMSRCWLFVAPRLTIEPSSTSVSGRVSMIENKPLPISDASLMAGGLRPVVHEGDKAFADLGGDLDGRAVVHGIVVLREGARPGRAGSDPFLHRSGRVHEREGEVVAVIATQHEVVPHLDDAGAA